LKEPFSLEAQTSSNFILFMERSLPYAFYAGRNMNIRIDNSALNNCLTWHAGIFEEADNFEDSFNDFSD
jgi:phosphate-selective porin